MGPSTRDPARPLIDGASLIDPALHNPAIVDMLRTELSRSVIGRSLIVVPHNWSDVTDAD